MLEYLHISNLALIEDMSLEFSDGINVLTGETGAGKSFILKALAFVLGDKLTPDIVREGADRAAVEAQFTSPKGDLILKRELFAATGRSRFFINDSLKSREAILELRPKLISHTSQHAQQELLQPAFQARMLEARFPEPELLEKKNSLLAALNDVAAQIKNLEEKRAGLAEKRELLEMQNAEIEKVSPQRGEEEKLETLRAKVKSREDAKKNYDRAMALLHGDDGPGILDLVLELERLLKQMGRENPEFDDAAEAVESARQEFAELANRVRKPPAASGRVDMNEIEERLFAFAQLKRKLKRNMEQILDLKDEIRDNLSFLDACALDLSRLAKEEKRLVGELRTVIETIAPLREAAAEKFSAALEAQLRDLGFSEHVKVVPEFLPREIWPGVNDARGRLLWAPNPGQKPLPLDKIASGGELSRFLLGLNIIDRREEDISYIFDEVDAGVGGLTLNKVAAKLRELSAKSQIILITHWPKLAAGAKRHFHISKSVKDGKTYTQCVALDEKARVEELARMAGGGREGEALAGVLS